MTEREGLYLGLDLSTQQLKALLVDTNLRVRHSAVFDFDRDRNGYESVRKGVQQLDQGEVVAPVLLWLQALDSVLQSLRNQGVDFTQIKGISGAGQQHGSVFWSQDAPGLLASLKSSDTLEAQLSGAFSWQYSPNWQDASTGLECQQFDKLFEAPGESGEAHLAQVTGSKSHHRFTGPQIKSLKKKHPEAYDATLRISVVSSFLASLFLGEIAPIDTADACGMNLYDMPSQDWHNGLLELTHGSPETAKLKQKLGDVCQDGGRALGPVSRYLIDRYGFDPGCQVYPFTGDNPATILALPLHPLDAIVSLGTSTTFLMSTTQYKPHPDVHLMHHPTTKGRYMFMLCYKNGGLAREQVRDAVDQLPLTDELSSKPIQPDQDPWTRFNHLALTHPPLNTTDDSSIRIGLYYPLTEIVPRIRAGQYRRNITFDGSTPKVRQSETWNIPADDPRAIIESQLLSLRLRSRSMLTPSSTTDPNSSSPAQPRRIYLVGGAAHNPAITQLAGEILGGTEGVYRLDFGGNACALGAAYKAVWAGERSGETFEDFLAARWAEGEFAKKVTDTYQAGRFQLYERGVGALDAVERAVLREYPG